MRNVQPPDRKAARGAADLLAIGFGTTVAMWAVGYVGHMPLTDVPPAVFVSLMLACVVGGGWVVGCKTSRGAVGGISVGVVVALLNLLILGSLLSKPNTGQVVPQAALWVPGYFLLSMALAAIGAAIGTAFRSPRVAAVAWDAEFAWVACAATLLLISIGGLVTGFRAGMAVSDWPATFGYNMFFYPFAKMTGGVFYEHAHRLMGSLVGLTTFTLAVLLTVQRRAIGTLVLIWLVFVCVTVQGIMGGLRVTENNVDLAVVHGFFAHVVLAGMVCVAVLLSRRPRDCPDFRRTQDSHACSLGEGENGAVPFDEQARTTCNKTDCLLSTLLVAGVLLQTLLGTLLRQKNVCQLEHISVAMLVAILAIVVGVRLWGLYPHVRVLARGGGALVAVVVLQLCLGGISLMVRTPPAVDSPSAEQLQSPDALQPALHAVITTCHQTTAAVLLGVAVFSAVWCWRLRAECGVKPEHIAAKTSGGRLDYDYNTGIVPPP